MNGKYAVFIILLLGQKGKLILVDCNHVFYFDDLFLKACTTSCCFYLKKIAKF